MTQTSPFNYDLDPAADKDALVRALQIVDGFALYFVVSEVSRVRPRLLAEISARLANKRIQRIHITRETSNLLHLLQDELEDPLPDIVFVSGFESVISAGAEPRSHPLLLNLNFTRNNFYALLPRPMVLWVPPFVVTAMLQGAPDFMSVRSGVYKFVLDPNERGELAEVASSIGRTEVLGFSQPQRDEHIAAIRSLLSEFRSLPASRRNPLDEAQILNQLGIANGTLGNYAEAEQQLEEALAIRRTRLPEGNQDIATSMGNLAEVFSLQGKLREAQPLILEALAIRQAGLSPDDPYIAFSLHSLGVLYSSQNRFEEAEALIREALDIRRRRLPSGDLDIANSLNSLALSVQAQERFEEAEELQVEAQKIRVSSLPKGHPDIAVGLNNLAILYRLQGRYSEAEELYREAIQVLQASLGTEHTQTQMVQTNLGRFLEHKELQETVRMKFAVRCNNSIFSAVPQLSPKALNPVEQTADLTDDAMADGNI